MSFTGKSKVGLCQLWTFGRGEVGKKKHPLFRREAGALNRENQAF